MEKLIRHKVPDIPHEKYPNMQVRRVESLQEHVRLLIEKIYEESHEVLGAQTLDARIREFADLMEVADTLVYLALDPEGKRYIQLHEALILQKRILIDMNELGVSEESMYQKKQEIQEKRGGFREGIVWIQEDILV